jgi:hypothetical protein
VFTKVCVVGRGDSFVRATSSTTPVPTFSSFQSSGCQSPTSCGLPALSSNHLEPRLTFPAKISAFCSFLKAGSLKTKQGPERSAVASGPVRTKVSSGSLGVVSLTQPEDTSKG